MWHEVPHSFTCSPTFNRPAHPALTPASKAATLFTYPGGMEGWVDLGALITPWSKIEPTTTWSKVRCPNRCATKTTSVPVVCVAVKCDLLITGHFSPSTTCLFACLLTYLHAEWKLTLASTVHTITDRHTDRRACRRTTLTNDCFVPRWTVRLGW